MSQRTARNSTGKRKKMSESQFMIKCVMCKTEFDQSSSKTRLCEKCKSYERRKERQSYYEQRKKLRKELGI